MNYGWHNDLYVPVKQSFFLLLQIAMTCPIYTLLTGQTSSSLIELMEAEWCIYVSAKHTNIASDNGLSPDQHQAITLTNAAILSIRP